MSDEKETVLEVTITRERGGYDSVHDCLEHVKKAGIVLTPAQEFRLAAIFK